MKKWALQMQTMGKYFKHSAMIDGKYNKNWSRAIFIILSIMFFGAFFIWFNDTATFLGNDNLTSIRTEITDKFMNGGTFEMADFEAFSNAIMPLMPNIIRIFLVPILTILISLLIVFPYFHINIFENCTEGEQYVGKKLLNTMTKSFGKYFLVISALIVPVILVAMFGGAKWFLNYGLIPTIIFALLYLISFFTICFQIDPDENDEGAQYPYDAISKQVKTIIHARVKENDDVPMNEKMKDIGDIVHNLEKSYVDEQNSIKVNKTPFKKALLLFKITWGRSVILMLILQYIIPMLQVLLISVLKFTQRDMIVYAGLGFFTAFAAMFEVRFVCKLYYDLIHGVKLENKNDNDIENNESEDF